MKKIFSVVISFLLTIPVGLQAQFIHFQMNVEPELSTDVVQNLNFGNSIVDSGMQHIEKGSPDMGIFEIRGLRTQNVAVTLDPPKELQHSNPDIEQSIPATLEASYTAGIDDISQSLSFSGNKAWFMIGGEDSPSSNKQPWQSAYVYIYGNISIGDIPGGTYDGTLVLTVEYQ